MVLWWTEPKLICVLSDFISITIPPDETTESMRDDDAESKIRTGLDDSSIVPNEHDVPPNSPAGRKVSVLGVEVVDRGQWSGPLDFLMSMIAYAVGLGNVWRFPYLCFKNGGGSFLVAYFFFFFLGAVPIFMCEVTVGQYLQRGAMEMWKMCPLFKGVGIGNVVIAFMCISYFCVISAWAIFYMISSFTSVFPWETCNNYWNTITCINGKETPEQIRAIAANLSRQGLTTETSVEQFWERRVLQSTDDLADFGGIQWELFGIMAIAWFVYFCALFPYALVIVLLIRGLTLPGAMTGISFYLTPNITKLSEATVWKDAGTQVFYSYGVGFGTLIALGSHNKFNHNCYRDSIIMCFINGSTSILAGFAIFSILGYMSVVANKDIAEIVKPGVGLAFLAYPEVCMMEGLFTALEDTFPTLLRKYKKISLLCTCIFFFILGIPMVTYSGSHWLTLVDNYGASGYALFVRRLLRDCAHRVRQALKEMVGRYPAPIFPLFVEIRSTIGYIG
ncbi:Sodium-and chloride-dependent creatine transporter 1 [Aphelenchoides besseyi]|nr:Sodium-and chloride-dependent creatine transporter 1 [Aphelenchoides besseyi]